MKYFFSLAERKNFLKNFSILFISFILFLGFSHLQGEVNASFNLILGEEQNGDISIFPPKKISIIHADERFEVLTYSRNVNEVLKEYNLEYSEQDIILPSLNYNLKDTSLIKIILIDKELVRETEKIPFETKRVEDSELAYGKKIIVQEGGYGLKEITYEEIFENETLVKRSIHKEEIVKKPIKKIINLGTKKATLGISDCKHWNEVIDRKTEDARERKILKSLIICESNCNDSKSNSNRYFGLLQFSPNTFYHYGGKNIWNGEEQISAALNILRAGDLNLKHHWPKCSEQIN